MKRLILLFSFTLFFSNLQATETPFSGCPIPSLEDDPSIECNTFEVPENRDNPDSRKISLAYIVLKKTVESSSKDAIVYLMGGPGGPATITLNSWRNSSLRRDRDFVLIDQRGTGYSSAVCTDLGQKIIDVLAKDLTPEEEVEEIRKAAASCKSELKKEGVDQNGYTTIQNAQDLDDLRKHLGYEHWDLFGGSYGSRLALAYMRDFPEHTRSAAISGLFPPQVNLYENLTSHFGRSLNKVFEACENDPNCSERYPNFREDFFAVKNSLEKDPYTFDFNGSPFTLNAQDFLVLTHQLSYVNSTIGLIPLYVNSVKTQNVEGLVPVVKVFAGRANIINIAMNWSLNAHDEYTFADESDYDNDLRRNPELAPGMGFFNSDNYMLKDWHQNRAPAYVNEPVVSDIPTFVANGDFDPITPPVNAEITMKTLSKGQYALFTNESHSVFNGCYFGLVEQFFQDPSTELDVSCANQPIKINWQ